MPDKLMRDELLRSHRYQRLSNDTAKLMFVHLVLSSDSLSNAEATTTALSLMMARTVVEEAAATILGELADKDLVRIYEADGKRYVHIPRSRQRMRYLKGKHPRPPANLEDYEITELIQKVRLTSDRGQTQDARSEVEVKRSEEKRSDVVLGRTVVHKSVHKSKISEPEPALATNGVGWTEHWKAKGKSLGIVQNQTETDSKYCDRVREFERQRKPGG